MRRILLLATLAVMLAACGGNSGGGNVAAGPAGDPVAAVNNLIAAIKAKAFDKLGPLVCAAKREEILGQLSGAVGSGAPSDLAAAMGFDFKDVKVEQKSVDGDKGVVHVTGTMTITFDAAKGKDAVRKMFEAAAPSGTVVTDAQVDQMILGITGAKPTDMTSDVDVVKENGGWVVCSNFASS